MKKRRGFWNSTLPFKGHGGWGGAGGSRGAGGMRSGEDKDVEGSTPSSSEVLGRDPSGIFNSFDSSESDDDGKHQDNLLQMSIVDLSVGRSAITGFLARMEKYPKWQPGTSEHTFRARVVQSAWASIENVCKISSSVLVNKLQCEHIADHFKVTGDVLKTLGLGKDFVSGQVLEDGSDIQSNLTFDQTRFNHIADTFEKNFYEPDSLQINKIWEWSRKFREYIGELPTMDGSSDEFFIKKRTFSEDFKESSLQEMSTKENVDARSGYWVHHPLDEFLFLLFEVLQEGEGLVLYHSVFEGANNGFLERASGEEFFQIHELLYKLLDCYDCLEHCEGTEFASGFLSRPDVCRAESILYLWNSNCLRENASLVISNNFLNIEMATRIANMLKRSNCALKKLSIESWPGDRVDQEELRKCRLMIIAALSESVGLTSLTIHASNGTEVRELCKSLRASRVLENLVLSTDGPLADYDAKDLYGMLTENHSLKSFTLEFDDISPEGVLYLGAMLTEISLDEIYLRSRGLRGFIKYLLGLSMAYIDGKRYAILSVEDQRYTFKILRYEFTGWELPTNNSQKLRIIKTWNRLSIKFTDLDPDAVCEILDSLKKNKTLQVLELESWPRDSRNLGDNREVAACLEALLDETSSLTELKVQFREWDKCFVQHLLRPLMAEKDGDPHVNISLRKLHIIHYLDTGISPNECGEVVESIAQMLRTNKMLSHFSMINGCLKTSSICEIVDSLKINKALQVFHLEERKVFDDPRVKVAFIDLLVNYNFTLTTMKISISCLLNMGQAIEDFMKNQLMLDTKMALKELWSLVCTTSDSPIVDNAHDLKQDVGTLQLEKGEGSTEEVCGYSKRVFDKHNSKMEAKDERPQLFLSYSNEMRDFAMLLCKELKSSNYNVVDQDSVNFAGVVDHCQLAIVVLSDMYVNSKSLMSELCTIVKSKKTSNPTLKVYPLFYKLTQHDLQNTCVPASIFGGKGSSLDIAAEREALDFLCEGKNQVSRKANDLVENLSQGRIDVGKFCEEFSELQKSSWPSNGLEFEKNAIFKEGYLHAILEEISHYMPVVKECNGDQTSWHQDKLEMESKLSLRQMKPLLESLPMRDFYLLRKFNMAQYLQEKYIRYSSFEEMCPFSFSREQKDEYSKGRIVAVLFPTTFLYHFKVHMFKDPHGGNFLPMLKAVVGLVFEKMQKECNQNGVQTSRFFDFVDYGAPLNPRRMIAMCQNFSMKTSDGSTQLVIVQDDLTKAYYYQCVEASNLGNLAIDETIGVIGVQVTSKEIHVDNIHEDGSSYSGVLGDFSYKFDFGENKQCAAKAFGDLAGARFLSKSSGIKCSSLLIIALASAIKRKGLTLTWRNGKGHMEFYPKHAEKVEVEASACQIQYTGNINQLGLDIEWGTGTNSCAPCNQTFQRGTNEIVNQQVFKSNEDQSMGTSSSRDDGTADAMDLQNDITLLNVLVQNKITRSGGAQVVGNGLNFSYETRDSETKQMKDEVLQDILRQRYSSKGGFHKISTLDVEYPDLENRLLNCQLHEVYDHNYLVVYNVSKARHISIYKAIEQNEVVPKFELTWISDIPIDGGEVQIKQIFETGLKGRELIVKRDGSNFTQLKDPSRPLKKIVPGYQESLLKFKSKFPSNAITTSMSPILVPNLVGKLKSQNQWMHIIGPQAKYEASYKYWWKATSMEAIVYSRTMYTSGTLLTTETKLDFDGIGHIGYCSVEEGPRELKHSCCSMVSRGKFSRPPGSLLDNKVLWGGLEIVLENSSLQ